MTTTPLDQWPKWRETLIMRLRFNDVPGDQIGNILLEVEEHCRESGESPAEAFGPPKAYGESRSSAIPSSIDDDEDDENQNLFSRIFIPGLGGFLLATGAFEIGLGAEAWGSSRSWTMLFLGALLLTWVFVHLPIDRIGDPHSGEPLFRERREMTVIMLSLVFIAAAFMYLAGRLIP